MPPNLPTVEEALPKQKDLFYNGTWNAPGSGTYKETFNPGDGQVITRVAEASASDVDAAIQSAHTAFTSFKRTPPATRAALLRQAAQIVRDHATELAFLDALNTGNPIAEMLADAHVAATQIEYFAGLIPTLKGETIPVSDENFHYTVREPLGVVARIVAFNHPVLFAAAKLAAPIAAGNTVVLKPPEQAPLSCLRLAELLAAVFPPGVLSILAGGVACGKALSTHPLVRKITLIGSVPTGKAIASAAGQTLKGTIFELGGKNALIALPDADVERVVQGVARGMNFTWAGQSCGSTSRVFLHESLHDRVLDGVLEIVKKEFKPGKPTDMKTTMGPVISKVAHDRVLGYIRSGKEEGATLLYGGKVPEETEEIKGGYFIEPTIFVNVNEDMKIAKEEIFGPVMSVFQWSDESDMLRQVNALEYGLTASIFTKDMVAAQRMVKNVEVGYVWVNQVGRHFLNVPFGGWKESGGGREESIEELFAFTQTKSVHLNLT